MVATVGFARGDTAWLEGPGGKAGLAALLRVLHEAMPVTRESALLADPAPVLGARHRAAALVLALVEILTRDFCVQPRPGELLGQEGDAVRLLVPCDEPELAQAALALAALVLQGLPALGRLPHEQVLHKLHTLYRELRARLRSVGLNQSTVALARAAWARGIPAYRLGKPGQVVQLGQGAVRQRVMETGTDRTSLVARHLCSDKFATVRLLRLQGLPTPESRIATSLQQAVDLAAAIGYPVVVKPRSLGKGVGVHVGLRDEAALRLAVEETRSHGGGVIVERHVDGDDHRLLVVGGRLVAAARRVPAGVVGDGLRTVRELVAAANADPRRGVGFERVLVIIELDDEAARYLAQQQLDATSVPTPGRWVRLRGAANISRGGTAVDVTDAVHPDNRQLAERAARVMGLDVAGIDFLVPDIARSWHEQRCAVLEFNETPGLRPHLDPSPGRDVAGAIVEHLFAAAPGGRVPTIGVTGSLGKTTTCRMTACILAQAGWQVALSTTQGAWVGTEQIARGDVAGGRMALDLLLDPAVQAGVFELSRGGLVKSGMHIDAVDVGVVLNVQDNHLGLDGIHTREQLAEVKGLVARHARRLAVLNADDPLCLALRGSLPVLQLCLVSEQAGHPEVERHVRAGGLAVSLQGSGVAAFIRLQRGADILGDLPVAGMPATWQGRFRPAVANAMFAAAAALGVGIDVQTIGLALSSFVSDRAANPGRMNLLPGLPGEVLVTWADGPVAMRALREFVCSGRFPARRTLVLSVVGSRPDRFIIDAGHAAAGAFSRYVCTDMESDRRGRPPGEVAGLLAQGLRQAGVAEADITVEPSDGAAVQAALATLDAGSLLLIVSYDTDRMLARVEQAGRA